MTIHITAISIRFVFILGSCSSKVGADDVGIVYWVKIKQRNSYKELQHLFEQLEEGHKHFTQVCDYSTIANLLTVLSA